jgi:hypothetical protein
MLYLTLFFESICFPTVGFRHITAPTIADIRHRSLHWVFEALVAITSVEAGSSSAAS